MAEFPIIWGNFVLLCPLALGERVDVYLAFELGASPHPQLSNRLLRLKKIKSANKDETLSYLQKELRSLMGLKSYHVAKVYSAKLNNDWPVVLEEYVEGISLVEALQVYAQRKNAPMPLDVIVEIARQSILSLSAIHENKDTLANQELTLMHGNITGESFVLSSSGYLKLIDVGTLKAVPLKSLTKSETSRKPLRYEAPEKNDSKIKLDWRADIYSWGVVIQELMGNLPIDDELRAIFDKATASDRELRYQSAFKIADLLQDYQTKYSLRSRNDFLHDFIKLNFSSFIDNERSQIKTYLAMASSLQKPSPQALKPTVSSHNSPTNSEKQGYGIYIAGALLLIAFVGVLYLRELRVAPRSSVISVQQKNVHPKTNNEKVLQPAQQLTTVDNSEDSLHPQSRSIASEGEQQALRPSENEILYLRKFHAWRESLAEESQEIIKVFDKTYQTIEKKAEPKAYLKTFFALSSDKRMQVLKQIDSLITDFKKLNDDKTKSTLLEKNINALLLMPPPRTQAGGRSPGAEGRPRRRKSEL